MKKIRNLLLVLLALAMIICFAACNKSKDGKDDDDDDDKAKTTTKSVDIVDIGDIETGGITQAEMEAELLRRLSGISNLTSLSLCGGTIQYTHDGVFFDGDFWAIKNPTIPYSELKASIKSQLEAAGFTEKETLLGIEYTVKAGAGTIGISIVYDENINEITIQTTHQGDKYTMSFIEAENAKLPTLIEGRSVLDKLPTNFSVSWEEYNAERKYTLCRLNGSWYYSHETTNEGVVSVSYDVAELQADGTYKYYDWYTYNGKTEKPSECSYFCSSNNTLEEQLKNIVDYAGDYETASLSSWLQMCWDYKELPAEDTIWGDANNCFDITENMTKTGTETIAGLSCEIVRSEGLWEATYEMAFDTATGMLCRYTEFDDSGKAEMVGLLVTEYTANPSSLGTYQPAT